MAEFFAFLVVAVYLIALLPRLNAGAAAVISAALFGVLFAAEIGLMTTQAI